MIGSAKRRSLLGALVLAALTALIGASCIKRQKDAEPVGVARPANGAEQETATGKYGQVQGMSMVPEAGLRAFQVSGKAERVNVSLVQVTGQPFSEALRAEVKERSGNVWDVQLQTKLGKAVEAGDVLLATFYLRAEATRQESGEGQTELVMELAREPWSKSVSYPVRAGREWKKVFVRFKAAQAYQPSDAQLIFRLGYEPQLIEIAGVTLENFGKQLVLADLPTTKLTYPGMQPDAAWRQAAAERIEKIRKGELSVSVKDKSGKPVPGVDITVTQKKQAFGFGSALVAQTLNLPGNERYKELTTELFNVAVLENNFKWQPLAGDWGGGWSLDVAKQGVDWLAQRGLPTRGHVLVWPSWRNLPKSLKSLEKDPVALRAEVRKHVRELAIDLKGKLFHWDVLNEPFDNHDLMDLLGDEVMVEWFKEARAADPLAKLFINDYAILSGGGGETPHREHYEKTIKLLIDKGAPLDGIGMQGHFGTALTSPDDMLKILDRFAKFGKQIWITEFDVDVEDEALAGQFTRDFYTTLYSHPAVGGILMWGFWDGAHWHKNAPLYRQDWSLKPAGQAYRDLVLKAWRTNVNGKTNANGAFKTRAFLGSFEVKVTHARKTKTQKVELPAAGAELAIVLD